MIKNVIVNPSSLEIPVDSGGGGGGRKRSSSSAAAATTTGATGATVKQRRPYVRKDRVTSPSSSMQLQLDRIKEMRKRGSSSVGGVGEGATFDKAIEFMTDLEKEKRKRGSGLSIVSLVLPESLANTASPASSIRIIPAPSAAAGARSASTVPLSSPPSLSVWDPTTTTHGTTTTTTTAMEEIDLPLPQEIYNNPPKYGCLKYGTLWRGRKTQKIKPPSQQKLPSSSLPATTTSSLLEKIATSSNNNSSSSSSRGVTQKTKYCKKISRRVHKVGKRESVVGVLISNKVIRHDIMEKMHVMKRKHIGEVRKYLYHHGFIKIGSCAPDDLLRSIFENSSMICGVVDNHNPDNLLFNYLCARNF